MAGIARPRTEKHLSVGIKYPLATRSLQRRCKFAPAAATNDDNSSDKTFGTRDVVRTLLRVHTCYQNVINVLNTRQFMRLAIISSNTDDPERPVLSRPGEGGYRLRDA